MELKIEYKVREPKTRINSYIWFSQALATGTRVAIRFLQGSY